MKIVRDNWLMIHGCIIAMLLFLVTMFGVMSYGTEHAYEVVNLYGEKIKLWGTGIYSHDSYFKAPIFIGSDFTMLVIVLPWYINVLYQMKKEQSIENDSLNFSVLSIITYYSASLAFGVTYNVLHLLYIVLFSSSFYLAFYYFIRLFTQGLINNHKCTFHITKGMKNFLLISGFALFVAWLPDIVSSLYHGTSLELIEVYTTEITYVFDMGIISPMIFITLYLVNRKKFIGYVLIRMLFKICIIIGIMLPIQSIYQIMSGITIPIPTLITKILMFVAMALFAAIFEYRIRRDTQYI